MKSCGKIDTFENVLCVDKTKNCPILNIRINSNMNIKLPNDKIITSKNIEIITNNNPNDYPNTFIPSEFKISENKPSSEYKIGPNAAIAIEFRSRFI